ncbi:MAG: translation initiation factor [Candidatus Kapaibacteriota bacterium]
MAKLTSLADLQALLPEDFAEPATNDKPASKLGYDGKAQQIRITSEKRANKTVTLLRGFQSNPKELETLTDTLKKQCGTGGRVLDNEIELQGDHRTKASSFLAKQGFSVKQ